MTAEIIDLVGKVAPGVIAALVAGLVTVRLALGRFKKEALWQRKLDAYTRILDALHVCRLRSEQLMREATQEVKLSKESTDEMRKKYSAASAELHRMVDTGLLILPEAATSHLTEVMEPRYDDWREMPPYLFWETEEHLMKKALDALMRVARADLKE